MTKEELEKEAKDSWWNDNNCSGALSTEKIYECGYLAGAEPREKRIAELEKENAELKKQLEMSNKVYNDNLDYSHHIEEQLTKAKELLKRFIELENCTLDYDDIKEAEQFLSEVEK